MQVGGIGSGNSGFDNHGISHRVTDGFHEHGTARKQTGGASLSSPAVPTSIPAEKEADGTFSLWESVRKTAESGKRLLGRIWGGDADTSQIESQKDDKAGKADGAALTDALSVESIEAGSISQAEMLVPKPDFTAAPHVGKGKENLLQRLKVRFQNITDLLKKRFGGSMTGNKSFSTKSSLADNGQQTKQDTPRQSRYREQNGEIDSAILDDSYLMNSYDRHGKYTQLGAGSRHEGIRQ